MLFIIADTQTSTILLLTPFHRVAFPENKQNKQINRQTNNIKNSVVIYHCMHANICTIADPFHRVTFPENSNLDSPFTIGRSGLPLPGEHIYIFYTSNSDVPVSGKGISMLWKLNRSCSEIFSRFTESET